MSGRPHVHHWRIEPASGPTSEGVCLGCAERRAFRNSLDDGYELSEEQKTRISAAATRQHEERRCERKREQGARTS